MTIDKEAERTEAQRAWKRKERMDKIKFVLILLAVFGLPVLLGFCSGGHVSCDRGDYWCER